MLDIERERILNAPPADGAWARSPRDALTPIEEGDAGAAHEPLERPADEVVDAARGDVERQRTDGLIRVNDEQRSLPVAELRERGDVLDPASREIDLSRAHRRRALVDRSLEELQWDAHPVRAPHELDLRTTVLYGEERVPVGREVEVGHDHLRPLGVIQRARDADEPRGDVRLDGDLVVRSAEDPRDVGPKSLVLGDPMVVPGSAAPLRPLARKTLDALPAAAVQRRQRAVVEVDQAVGDREFGTPAPLAIVHHQPAA